MAEKMLTLTESFRTVLRARYPSRPALADEIQSSRYFHSAPWCHCRLRRLDPEAQAADEALETLKDGIMSGAVRLRAILGDNLPNDIEPMEVVWNGVHVFDNTLEVYELGRTLRTYRKVHCYPADIETLIGRRNESALTLLEAAERGVKACYPDRVPHDVVNTILCRNVGAWVKANLPNMPDISDSTIKRAAGRKK